MTHVTDHSTITDTLVIKEVITTRESPTDHAAISDPMVTKQ